MSTEERRALAIIAALLVLTGAARYIERPRPLLPDEPSIDLVALEAASRGEGEPERAGPARPVDPNTASVKELDALPGVGAALAARIVAERARARFARLEDLRRVQGIGPAMLEKLAPHVSLKRGEQRMAGGGSTSLLSTQASPATVDLNTADAVALDRLDGIGPALAARLVARRDSLGRFRSWDDVDAVQGVGPAMLAKLRQATVLTQ